MRWGAENFSALFALVNCIYIYLCFSFNNVRLDEGGKKHLRLTTERSKKPTMAREWRKLNQKNKSRTETEVVEKKKKEVM